MNDLQPFCKCLRPRVIKNKYSGERIVAKCGKCSACLNAKSINYTRKCQIESLSHKYSYFVTLTYDMEHVPLAKLQYDDDIELWSLIAVSPRIVKELDNPVLSYYDPLDIEEFNKFRHNINKKCGEFIPFLYKRDIQLFLKRLRKRITNEKIRYFLSGEYGTKRYRSHYHLILWFEEEQTSESLRAYLHQTWTYGDIDISQAREQCASYVAGYVNSYSQLPRLYQHPSIRPFNVHSRWLAQAMVESLYQEKQSKQDVLSRVNSVSININDRYRDIVLWRSLENIYYPKCKGYSYKSDDERLFSYRLYEKIKSWTGETSAFRQARRIVACLQLGVNPFPGFITSDCISCLIYFKNNDNVKRLLLSVEYDDAMLQNAVSSVYRELYVSKHFYNLRQELNYTSFQLLSYIKEYYSLKDYQNYLNQVAEYENFVSNRCVNDDSLYMYFFPDSFMSEEFMNEDFYNTYKNESDRLANDKIKHKKLNDLNGLLDK